MDSYEMTLLIDFYGQLLTSSQFACLDMHYNNDMSLAEIADELKISRQGAFDFIKRGRTALEQYEKQLGLVKRFLETKSKLEDMQNDLMYIDKSSLDAETQRTVKRLENNLYDIISKL